MKKKYFCAVFLLGCAILPLSQFSCLAADNALLPRKAFETARKALIRVEIYFKKPERPEEVELDEMADQVSGGVISRYVEEKQSKDLVGVVMNAAGDVLVPEIRLDEATLDRIEVISWDGERKQAKIKALLLDSPAMVLEVEGGGLKNVAPPQFVPAPSPEKEVLRIISLYYAKPRWELQSSTWSAQSVLYEKPEFPLFQYSSDSYESQKDNARIIFNASGDAVGIDVTSTFEENEETGLWKGESFARAASIPYDEYNKFRKDWAQNYDAVIHEVKVEFRKKARGDSGPDGFFGKMLSAAEDRADESFKELKGYGPVIDSKVIFVPLAIPQSRAKLIDKITVTVGKKPMQGKFLGAFKPFAGFLVELQEGQFPQVADLGKAEEIPRVKPFYMLRAQEKLGGKYMIVLFNRWLQMDKGYKNEYHWQPEHSMREGDFILDAKGRLAGVWLSERKEGEEIRKAARAQSYSFMGRSYSDREFDYSRDKDQIFYSAQYLAKVLASPEEYFDPTIKALSKDEERRRFWLGVEFDPINKDLAKSLKVEKPTVDGTIGLLVSTVYDNSPASKIGIKPGDILLRIKPEGDMESLDMKYAHEQYDFNFDEGDIPPQLQSMGFKMPEKAPWRSQENYLNNLLETMGGGRKISLTYLSEGQEKSAQLTIEPAPVDFDSAPKFRDKDLGLTVKDMTYEVRKALDMKPDAAGVVIAKLEEGSPASVARLNVYEIISQVDGKPVMNSDEFGNAIKAAREKQKDTVQLQVISLDKTRFADLQLKVAATPTPN